MFLEYVAKTVGCIYEGCWHKRLHCTAPSLCTPLDNFTLHLMRLDLGTSKLASNFQLHPLCSFRISELQLLV